jgi:hypothetical protein
VSLPERRLVSFAPLGQWDGDTQAAHEGLRLKPDYPLARNALGWPDGEKQSGTR